MDSEAAKEGEPFEEISSIQPKRKISDAIAEDEDPKRKKHEEDESNQQTNGSEDDLQQQAATSSTELDAHVEKEKEVEEPSECDSNQPKRQTPPSTFAGEDEEDLKRTKHDELDESNQQASGGGTDQNPKKAEEKFELRLLIATKAASAVIGKGGESIKALRSKYDAIVTVPDRSTAERILTIVCSQERVLDCFSEVLEKLAEYQGRDEVDIRLLINQSLAGAIIGKAGARIEELRKLTKAKITLHKNCAPRSNDRVVQIICQRSQMSYAVKLVLDAVREAPPTNTNTRALQQYDPCNYDGRGVHSYGGWYPGGGGGSGAGRDLKGNNNQQLDSTKVTIPNELAGTIIGKGGDRISRIRAESGARIEIGNSRENEDRVITITGNPQQIRAAENLLQQSVRTSEVGRRYLREYDH